ncbi:MAG: hypothetical protein IJ960_06845 [Oscillospiraceae bacterium]|nr:hypothetical protein [Oscillospiraceae bacterium]
MELDNLREALEELFDFVADLPSGLDGFESDFGAAFSELEEAESVQRWIPVTERLPEERPSAISGLGDFSPPVLVAWVDTTSPNPYPRNCFVREGHTRNGKFCNKSYNGDLIPIAWQPLPEPPKEKT